ncbi:MAG TPA: phospholipid carrier-dependent glycosyltransferase [Candidatus Paceibacterota bacterium]|nr:phospholipid carrier-dependent glycosyltransferase [Candidatus Paceibacterota bacterium]
MFRRLTTYWATTALVLICITSFGLMLYASHGDSAIDDELAHIPAGYGYVHELSYDLNPEHPPLIKALAMLPVEIFVNPTFPVNIPAWTTEINGEWDMGAAFLYNSGNNADEIIQVGRVMPMLVTILTIILVYFLARRMVGTLWALLPTFMFALDPTVLGQGHYVTTDLGAAFGIMLGMFFFLKYIEAPSTKHLWWAGLAFGVAQLTKFSTPLLVPLFIFLIIVLAVRDGNFWRRHGHYAWKLLLIFLIGYVIVVYPVYTLFTTGYPIQKQISDTTTILASFASGPTPAGQMCSGMRCLADLDIWMSGNYITRPAAEYLLGILMALQRVDGGNTIYFLGAVRGSGGWIYFPVLFLLKEPIPTLIIVLLGLALALWWTVKRTLNDRRGRGVRARMRTYLVSHFDEFSLASFIVLYWGYSMHSPLNIGIRHILPTIPLIFILSAVVWKKWIMRLDWKAIGVHSASLADSAAAIARSFAASIAKYIVLILLLAWLLLETLSAAPYFLSYFNEFGGGVWGGYHFVTDSNYDWGQDLLRLQAWVNANPQVGTIAVDYFGGGDPHYYLGPKAVPWSSSMGDPADQGIHWLAVSVNTLEGAIQPLAPGQSRNASDTYAWLAALRPPADASGTWLGGAMGNVPAPDARAGTSIFIYHLP